MSASSGSSEGKFRGGNPRSDGGSLLASGRMFLRSITLRGFKSFADKTQLDFIPGVSVIVGPNGSGKSNLVDAISWGSRAPEHFAAVRWPT